MTIRRRPIAALIGVILVSIRLISAGATSQDIPDPNGMDNPLMRAWLTDRQPREKIEGQFSNGQECQNAVIRELLRATDEQWLQIESKFNELEAVRQRTRASVGSWVAGGSFGGGSGSSYRGARNEVRGGYTDSRRLRRNPVASSRRHAAFPRPARPSAGANYSSLEPWRPSQGPASADVTPGECLCGELLDLIDRADASSEEIREKMAQLAAYRRQADEEIKQAQQALRQIVNRRQEAMLILMGYLD